MGKKGNLNEYRNYKPVILTRWLKISGMHNEDRGLRESNTHRPY